jgi:hypothetical protein
VTRVFKKFDLKNNPEYAYYNFLTKKNDDAYRKTGRLEGTHQSIYNENAVTFVLAHLDEINSLK